MQFMQAAVSVDLSEHCYACTLLFYDVYISSYSELICFYLLFQIRCVLGFKSIYLF